MNDQLPLVIANLKANKTWDQISAWIDTVAQKAEYFPGTVVFCPSAPFLSGSSHKITANGYKIKLGIQDISKFEQGAYTGEIAVSQIADFCQYAIIGHSERRQNFGETDEILAQKVKNAARVGITLIFCVQNENTPIPEGAQIVAYEPVFAIGTGKPDTPQDAKAIAQKLKAKGTYTVIYGGSVTSDNVKSFVQKGTIEGVLVGTDSKEPADFVKILESLS